MCEEITIFQKIVDFKINFFESYSIYLNIIIVSVIFVACEMKEKGRCHLKIRSLKKKIIKVTDKINLTRL